MGEELRVGVTLGLTLPIPGMDLGMVKPTISIEGLDPAGDYGAQLDEALAVARVALERVADKLAEQLLTLTPPDKIAELEASIASVRERLNQTIKRMRALATEKPGAA